MVLTGLAYSLVYCKSVSCKCLVDDPERKLSNSVVGGRVALHCDLLVMMLHEASLVSLCFYQATYTSSIRLQTTLLLTSHTDHAAYTLNGNFVVINGNTFNCYSDLMHCSVFCAWCVYVIL